MSNYRFILLWLLTMTKNLPEVKIAHYRARLDLKSVFASSLYQCNLIVYSLCMFFIILYLLNPLVEDDVGRSLCRAKMYSLLTS